MGKARVITATRSLGSMASPHPGWNPRTFGVDFMLQSPTLFKAVPRSIGDDDGFRSPFPPRRFHLGRIFKALPVVMHVVLLPDEPEVHFLVVDELRALVRGRICRHALHISIGGGRRGGEPRSKEQSGMRQQRSWQQVCEYVWSLVFLLSGPSGPVGRRIGGAIDPADPVRIVDSCSSELAVSNQRGVMDDTYLCCCHGNIRRRQPVARSYPMPSDNNKKILSHLVYTIQARNTSCIDRLVRQGRRWPSSWFTPARTSAGSGASTR